MSLLWGGGRFEDTDEAKRVRAPAVCGCLGACCLLASCVRAARFAELMAVLELEPDRVDTAVVPLTPGGGRAG